MTGLAGTRRLTRLALRRDRVQLPVWLAALTLLEYGSAVSIVEGYADPAERTAFVVTSANNAALLAFNGLVSGDSVGATIASQVLLIMLVGAAAMSTLTVVRHTRQNEETGRAELIGSAPVGRHAPLTAALIVAAGANLVLGVLAALALVACGLPAGGSAASGVAVAGTGIAFAALAAIAAQLTSGARAANGLAAAAIGAAFLLRGVGDATGDVRGVRVDPGWASDLSPIGWAQRIRPYDGDHWIVLLPLLALTAAAAAAAFALAARRDLGAGLLADRPGPPRAGRGLRSPLGLAWRLQRGVLLGWVVAVVVVAAGMGGVGDAVGDVVASSDAVADAIGRLGGGGSPVDAYFAAVLSLVGVAVAGYAVQALQRLRTEEGGPLEPVLATATGRPRWLAGHLLIAAAGVVLLLAVAGATTGLVYAAATGGNWHLTGTLTAAALVRAPAALVLAGFAVAAFGLLPRLVTAITWAVFAACLLLGQIGQLLNLPAAVLDASPFSHVPAAPVAPVTAAPLVVLTVVAAALTATGFAAFRRRDIG